MARKLGGIGPGAMRMGGAGRKPGAPPTPMASAPIGPGAPPGGIPRPIRPVTGPGAIGGGRPPPSPPGLASGAGPGGSPIAGGFKKGGSVNSFGGKETKKEERAEEKTAYKKGGSVGLRPVGFPGFGKKK